MIDNLLTIARRHAETFADADGVARTPLPGVTILRQCRPTPLVYAISSPLVALVLQGRKRVSTGSESFEFGAGDSLLIGADVPNGSQITRASPGAPYVSVVVDLDLALIEQLMTEIEAQAVATGGAVRVGPTDAEVSDTVLRLLRLLGRPDARPILCDQLRRELHYWLLVGHHGDAIQGLGVPGSRARHIARAVDALRSRYAETVRVGELARMAGMSVSSFHEHFRAVTSLTPLQFQKQLRLIEARRRLLAEGETISLAAFAVGYESVPQFTRDYGRFFGSPPGRDLKRTRDGAEAA